MLRSWEQFAELSCLTHNTIEISAQDFAPNYRAGQKLFMLPTASYLFGNPARALALIKPNFRFAVENTVTLSYSSSLLGAGGAKLLRDNTLLKENPNQLAPLHGLLLNSQCLVFIYCCSQQIAEAESCFLTVQKAGVREGKPQQPVQRQQQVCGCAESDVVCPLSPPAAQILCRLEVMLHGRLPERTNLQMVGGKFLRS